MNKNYLFGVLAIVLAILILSVVGPGNTEGNRITGFFILDPATPIEDINSTYALTPIFEVKTEYSLKEYEEVVDEARALLSKCKETDAVVVNTCVAGEVSLIHGWTIVEYQEFLYKFEVVKSALTLPFYNETTQKMENKQVAYRFALDFSV